MATPAGGYFSDVNFWVTQEPPLMGEPPKLYGHSATDTPAPGAPPAGEGFSLDLEQAQELLDIAMRIQTDLIKLQNDADALKELKPPADDGASRDYNALLTWKDGPGAFSYGGGHVKMEYDYVTELIKRLKDALGIKEGEDADVGKTIAGTANDGGRMG